MLNQLRNEITTATTLPKAMKAEAAEIYYGEFKQKYDGLLMMPRTEEQALHVLQESMNSAMGIYAFNEQGRLVGLVGLGSQDRKFINYKWKLLMQEFGLLGAALRKLIKFFESGMLKTGQLRVEGIVVSNAFQGKGIGTTLMNAVFEQAQSWGFQSICLEVINTNPGARRLYHRLGFQDTGRIYFGPLTRRAGFTSIWRMEKALTPTLRSIRCLR